jgi:hypothetical protein
MNERIKELSKQAREHAYTEYRKQTPETYSTNKEIEDFFEEKFAELIVRECLNQVRDEIQYIADWDKADQVVTEVKKHFGVEE